MFEQYTASTVDQILAKGDLLLLSLFFSLVIVTVIVAVLVRFKCKKKSVYIHAGTRMLIIIMMLCFVIDLRMQRTHSPCLLNYIILKLYCCAAGKELKSKTTRKYTSVLMVELGIF